MTKKYGLSARYNLNGNSRYDFEDAYIELDNARHKIEVAASKLLGDVAHGRNYQHLDNPDDTIIADRREIRNKCREASALLGTLQSSIVDILEEA